MNYYPNLSLSLILASTLVSPFVLKTFHPYLELYPAILLPSGAGRVNIDKETISFGRISLWGKNKDNDNWKRIDIETFLAPIPPHYFSSIVRNSFGLNLATKELKDLPEEFHSSVTKKNILREKVTPDEVKLSKQWLQNKLVQSGYAPDEVMVTTEKVNFDRKTEQITKSNRVYEEILRLD